MIERILLSALLAFSVVGNGWQWWNGHQRYAEGRAAERRVWNKVLEDRNAQIAGLAGELTEIYERDERIRQAAAAAARGVPLAALPPEVVAMCNLPSTVRAELDKITAGGAP